MARKTMDCRTMPSESNCTLTITGEEEEVLRTAVAHAVEVHGHTDNEELRTGLRAALTEAPVLELKPGAFVQVIEFSTGRIQELEEVERGWAEAIGPDRTARWVVQTVDRGEPGRFLQMVAFPDHDSAMANSKHPVTSRFAEKLAQLCDGEPTFRNVDVRRVEVF